MKAVLFDVYETLLTGSRKEDREPLLRTVTDRFGLEFPASQSLSDRLDQEVQLEHRQSPEEFPEIDIRDTWRRIFPSLTDADADGFALAAEEAIHPVTAIGGARETILEFHQRGIALGIISNAQAYTKILLDRHLGDAWHCFDPELLFFSYEHRIAKPDSRLFQLAKERLAVRGIPVSEVLMVGDSIKNDIEPARSVGFRTHLVPQTLSAPQTLHPDDLQK
ncbi:HAD family hydrolase [Haloferula sp.]|uniref:HAD family hydrolase n=1 Tax=Haloferula sp. TaxID=2497595 RepID=UPI00329D94D5